MDRVGPGRDTRLLDQLDRELSPIRPGAWTPSAQRPHPAGDGLPDLVRRIFLNKMDPPHRLLSQHWPPANEVDQRIVGEDRTWLSLQEQLGHIALPQPVRVCSRNRMHIGGLALDGYLPGPRQRRPSPSPGLANGRRYCAISSSESLRRMAFGRISSMK